MSVYKVPQDVEAEDKLIGPLTFRKAAFAGVMAAALATAYFMGRIPPKPFWALLPMPIAFAFGLLAFFPSKDQPVEVLLIAKIRFMFKPRRRIWDQRGVKQLVTITVPRREHRQLTKGYSENEVSSRLSALAKTLDSRGWAVKNVNLNTFSQPAYASGPSDQRLISPSILPQAMPVGGVRVHAADDIQAADDILDHVSNPVAQHFDTMMTRAAETQRRTAIDRMHQAVQETPEFHIPTQQPLQPANKPQAEHAVKSPHVTKHSEHSERAGHTPAPQHTESGRHAVGNPQNAGYATFGATTLQTPEEGTTSPQSAPNADEAEFLAHVHRQQSSANHPSGNMKRIKTPKEIEAEERAKQQKAEAEAAARTEEKNKQAQPSPDTTNPAILELANNDDLNIATLARQAKVATDKQDDGEVVISLR